MALQFAHPRQPQQRMQPAVAHIDLGDFTSRLPTLGRYGESHRTTIGSTRVSR